MAKKQREDENIEHPGPFVKAGRGFCHKIWSNNLLLQKK
jgi:hypothetical protein